MFRFPYSHTQMRNPIPDKTRKDNAMKLCVFFPKSFFPVFFLLAFPCLSIQAQSFEWKAEAYGFFDNGEYTKIDPAYSQTLSGFRLSPEIGIAYKDFSLFTGAHLQTSFGSPRFLDQINFTGYFQYKNRNHHFLFGAFPKKGLLDNYTDFYIRDTFSYFRPNMAGLFYQLSGKNNFINLWLDWTGLQSASIRETFFVGLSGEQRYKWFFAAFNGYYYHYAQTVPASGDGCVHDNGQGQVGIGFDFSGYAPHLHRMRFQVAYMLGYECKRDGGQTPVSMPMGLILDLHAQYWRIGTRTLYYYGDKRFTVPTDFHSLTYWGNPFLESDSYLQSQWYVSLFKNNFVEAKAAFVFHLQGTRLGTQQVVQLSVNLNGSIYNKREMEKNGGERYRFNFLGADKQHADMDRFGREKKDKNRKSRKENEGD